MRVLMVVRKFYPQADGAERQAHRLAKQLIQRGIDVQVVTGWWFRGTPRQEVIGGVPVRRNFAFWEMFSIKGLRKFGAYTYMLALFWYLFRQRATYDIIHIHTMNYHTFVGVLAGRLLSKPVIVKVACSGDFGDIQLMKRNSMLPGTKQMLPKLRECDCVVAINDQVEEKLLANGFHPEQIARIPNGIETQAFGVKRDYRLHDPIRLIFVGRLDAQKGVDMLLRGLQRIKRHWPDVRWELSILGEGELRQDLERLAEQLDVSTEARFCGKVEDVPARLGESDIFVLPSRAEGMSNALLEAMVSGLPCIATHIPGNLALIQDGRNGLLVMPNNPGELARAIEQVARDEQLRASLGRAARDAIEKSFALEMVADRYIELYGQLTASNIAGTENKLKTA
jgi:glycosyltransferase involved in cell wall biosynthesis